MPSPTALVNHSTPTDQRVVVEGYVSTLKAAPTKFGEGVFVIVPEHSTTVPIGPCEWGAIHGTALPKQGALCVVAYGEQEIPRVVWWEGTQKEPTVTEAFKAVVFENSWKNTGGGADEASYTKDPLGFVHLRGLIETGASGKIAFALPAKYRPGARAEFAAVGAGVSIASVQVEKTGTVTPFGTPAISLDTVSFFAEL